MTKISFSVPGVPVGQAHLVPKSGHGKPYMPKHSRDYQKLIFQHFKLAHPRCVTHLGPVIVRFTAIFPVPKSWHPSLHAAAQAGKLYHIQKPDKENLEEALWDALSPTKIKGAPINVEGHPWRDDCQCMGGGIKRYGSPSRLDVTIEFIDQPGGVITPTQARYEEKAASAQSSKRIAMPKRPAKPKTATTALERAIAAADARDAAKGGK